MRRGSKRNVGIFETRIIDNNLFLYVCGSSEWRHSENYENKVSLIFALDPIN